MPKSKSRGDAAGRRPTRRQAAAEPGGALTADEVVAVLRKGPLTLVQLGQRLNAVSGTRRRQFRQVLKALVKADDVQHDGDGVYGLVTRRLRRERAEAAVEAAPQPAPAEPAAEDTGLSATAIGVLRLDTRYPYVEVVAGDHKGRINLANAAPKSYREGDTVSIAILGEDRYGHRGTLTGRIARGGGAAQAAETLLATNDVPRVWPDGMEAVVAKLPAQVAPASFRDREDLRPLPLVTIDGETARDFDDAVYAERVGRGFRLIVAIADVAHYVKHHSLLDQEAELRGNSVYLPDRVIPMLPEALSNGLCSLRPEENRLAMVCDMRVSAHGRVSRFTFYEAVIRSWARLTYTEVAAYLEADAEVQAASPLAAPVRQSIDVLKQTFDALREEREARGGLDFEGREARVEVVDDRPVAVHPVQRNDAHKLIEEAMIAANVCAARFLEQAEVSGMYRIHEPPSQEKSELLRQALAQSGIRLPDGTPTPKMVQQALAALQTRDDAWLLESQVLRALSQACYSPSNKGHFGLALKRYMHFTSPIRRYADLVVHRAIKAALKVPAEDRASVPTSRFPRGAMMYYPERLADMGAHLSQTERRADETSWGVDAWLKCEYMAQFVGQDLDGIVVGVTEFGLFVELAQGYIQGLLHISELGRDYFQFQPLAMTLVGERSGLRYGLGDRLRVTLTAVNPPRGRLELVLAGSRTATARDRARGGRSGGRGKRRR
ncbi:MAG: ribonuclease R [Pseudomonadota bacterium]